MLAQSCLSADDLGITEPQCEALKKTLVLLETGGLVHADVDRSKPLVDLQPSFAGLFNLSAWCAEGSCGTIACIGGTAELIGNVSFGNWSFSDNAALINLCAPIKKVFSWDDVTPTQAARALRSYLNCGDAKWAEALA